MRCPHISVFCLSLLLFGLGSAAAQDLHPQLKSKEKVVRQALILPPKVELAKQGMKGAEGMLKESEEVAARLSQVVAKEMSGKKIKTLDSPFTDAALAENQEMKYALADLQARFDELLPKLRKKSKDVKQGRFTLGDAVASLNPSGAADVLVLIRASGSALTKGKTAFGILVGGATMSSLFVSLALIDARTGEVLYFAKPFVEGNFLKEENTARVIGEPLARALRKLPAPPAETTASAQAANKAREEKKN